MDFKVVMGLSGSWTNTSTVDWAVIASDMIASDINS